MADILRLKKSNCKNCFKCIRNCSVKAIRYSGDQAHINNSECILCGKCFVVCPQDAQVIVDATETVSMLLQSGETVVASVDPSFIAYFGGAGIGALRKALLKLGFSDVLEMAVGATYVKREYEKLLEEGTQDIIITSSCHSVNMLINKYYPQLAHCLAPVVAPMTAHCMDIKAKNPHVKTVFIGPCLAKKDEAEKNAVDAVMTFSELDAMLAFAGIVVEKKKEVTPESRARLVPTVGGILKSMDCSNAAYTYLSIDGVANCMAALRDIAAGNIHRCFIEMSACEGSCIGGPVMEKYRNAPIRHYQMVTEYAGTKDFTEMPAEGIDLRKQREYVGLEQHAPTEEEIRSVLRKMGKAIEEDELNCGICGYDTCRKMACAVCAGKADISMCLPYHMESSEHFSFNILNNTSGGIIVLNEDYEVQKINRAAMEMLGVSEQSAILGEQIFGMIELGSLVDVLWYGKKVDNQRTYYAKYDKFFEQTIAYDSSFHLLLIFLRDVTEQEKERLRREALIKKTAETADRVVDKQMRIVQEIASLLGETTAETKIALTKLKESMKYENDM